MEKKKVYISAPISGYDIDERRRYFASVATQLKQRGFEPVNPMKSGVPDSSPYEEHMRADLRLLLGCQHILLGFGWENSRGCKTEALVANVTGISIIGYAYKKDEISFCS